MSGPKWRINFKILPLHYDADAHQSVVFLCDPKLKLNKKNSHLLKYRVSFKGSEEKSEAFELFGLAGVN